MAYSNGQKAKIHDWVPSLAKFPRELSDHELEFSVAIALSRLLERIAGTLRSADNIDERRPRLDEFRFLYSDSTYVLERNAKYALDNVLALQDERYKAGDMARFLGKREIVKQILIALDRVDNSLGQVETPAEFELLNEHEEETVAMIADAIKQTEPFSERLDCLAAELRVEYSMEKDAQHQANQETEAPVPLSVTGNTNTNDSEAGTTIPIEHQSEPISMAEAARRLNYSAGKNDSEAGSKRVKREIKAGVLWAIQVSDKKWRFDKRIVKNSAK